MPTDAISHFVFVDFENVQRVDLATIKGVPVVVTFLIGKSQTKLDTALAEGIHMYAEKVRLQRIGASGRNALDLVLAYHLGVAVAETPLAEYYIISQDKDFDPLIEHLRSKSMTISRVESFSDLPFLPTVKVVPKAKTPVTTPKPGSIGSDESAAAKLEKLIMRLSQQTGPRPKRKKGLLSHINAIHGNRLSEVEVANIVQQLIELEICQIDADEKVSY